MQRGSCSQEGYGTVSWSISPFHSTTANWYDAVLCARRFARGKMTIGDVYRLSLLSGEDILQVCQSIAAHIPTSRRDSYVRFIGRIIFSTAYSDVLQSLKGYLYGCEEN